MYSLADFLAYFVRLDPHFDRLQPYVPLLVALPWLVFLTLGIYHAIARSRRGLPLFRTHFDHALFQEQWRSGHGLLSAADLRAGLSIRRLVLQFSHASRCLWITVAEGELLIYFHFPVNVLGLGGLGLEHRFRGSDITSVEHRPRSFFRPCNTIIRGANVDGREVAIELDLRDPEAFDWAVERIRDPSRT